jgi:hypothetical protein
MNHFPVDLPDPADSPDIALAADSVFPDIPLLFPGDDTFISFNALLKRSHSYPYL